MEQRIEGAIDSGLESLSSGLYVFSVGLNKKKGAVNIGLISLVLGVLAVISGLVQM